ncbi:MULTISPECIES: ATP-grasp domain-containing protein [unclassified Streptomyces]|uniref:ATP-grasp domain-containing protein n=1 Tax=unclassified Streptomyces TaxID=2593676 RepID=UPI00093D0BB6|nr:ATP-grasp domain-containing protein [Streptomyces sp. CB01883]
MKEAVVIFFRGEHERHLEVLEQAVRAVRDSRQSAVCLIPSGTNVQDGVVEHVRHYDSSRGEVGLTEVMKGIVNDFQVRRIIALAEQDVQPAARMRDFFGIPGMTSRESLYFRDKNAMAARAAEEGAIVAASCQPHTFKTLLSFAEKVGFPIVVKPYDGVSCTNTYKVRDVAELEQLWPLIEEQRHDYRAEEFVHGKQFHVDAILRDGEVIFEAISEYSATILDNIGSGPLGSVAHAGTQNPKHLDMMAQNRKIIRSFGLSTGVAHTEFYLQDDGTIVFGETAARMAGAWNTMIYSGAFGMELAYEWVRAEADPAYQWTPKVIRCAASEFLWTSHTGRIERITDREQLADLPGVVDVKIWKKLGDVIGQAEGSRGQDLGRVIIAGETADEVRARVAEVRRTFSVTCA